jgi:hypothetical protein
MTQEIPISKYMPDCPDCKAKAIRCWQELDQWGVQFYAFACGSEWHEVYDEGWYDYELEGIYEDVECPTKRTR